MSRSVLFLGLTLLSCGESLEAGGLKWEQTEISMEAMPADKKIEAKFSFSNSSSAPIEIRKVSTSCGCTTAVPSQKIYQPGESGTLGVVFTFGGRKGLQEKTILVQTEGEKDVLRLRVDIADSFKVNTKKLSWKVGDPFEAKTFDGTVQQPETTKVKGAKSLSDAFEAELKEGAEGKFQVLVKPLKTDRPEKGNIRLELADPGSRTVYLQVEVTP